MDVRQITSSKADIADDGVQIDCGVPADCNAVQGSGLPGEIP
jgi:hypothetical protein